jgi:hypothetical protein
MMRFLALGAFLLCSLVPGAARALTPFGGDDTGFIPPDTDNFKYEAKIGKNLAKFQKCVIKCHASRAKGKFADDVTEDGCEGICQQKYDLANSKLIAPAPASACLNTMAVRNLWESTLDSFNSQIYCAGTTPFGGDDTGFIPPDTLTFKCESKVGSHVAKLLACEGKCHEKRAKESLADDTAEDGCEADCKTKYNAANAKLTGCPPCLNASNLGDTMLAQGDNNNGQVYCAQ